jgi:Leucine rich repeat
MPWCCAKLLEELDRGTIKPPYKYSDASRKYHDSDGHSPSSVPQQHRNKGIKITFFLLNKLVEANATWDYDIYGKRLLFNKEEHLTDVYLVRNNITIVPESFSMLNSLKHIWLSGNAISNLPPSFKRLAHVTSLWLDNNALTSIAGVPNSVVNLDLSHNPLDTLESLEEKVHLKKLLVNHCFLEELPPTIKHLTSLRVFESHSNKLKFLPREIGFFTSLERLALHDNRIKILPDDLARLRSLRWMSLYNNPLPQGCVDRFTNLSRTITHESYRFEYCSIDKKPSRNCYLGALPTNMRVVWRYVTPTPCEYMNLVEMNPVSSAFLDEADCFAVGSWDAARTLFEDEEWATLVWWFRHHDISIDASCFYLRHETTYHLRGLYASECWLFAMFKSAQVYFLCPLKKKSDLEFDMFARVGDACRATLVTRVP